jgi:hypothetical protein
LVHDLQHVAPLGAVDVDAGGIVGKPWQSRIAARVATVAVAGMNLPLEGDAKPLDLPSADDGAGKKNLQQLAARWLAKRPLSVVGTDGAALVGALARAVGATVVDVTVRPDTRASDLLGPNGSVSLALAQGAAVHLHLDGESWPEGLGAALLAAGPKARLVATGAALPGFPVATLAPLDAPSVVAHVRALGVDNNDVVDAVAKSFVEVRALARDGELGVGESAYPLALLDRMAARLAVGGGAVSAQALHNALVDVLARRVAGDARGAVLDVIDQVAPIDDDDAAAALLGGVGHDGKIAHVLDARLQVVGVPQDASTLPLLVAADQQELRAAVVALELAEPVVADGDIAERVGTLYGALTGRDVHVHLVHEGSTVNDVLGSVDHSDGSVVAVVHGFASAPDSVQEALWQAAVEGRIRLVVDDAGGGISSDAVVLRAGPVSPDDQQARLRLRLQELGLPAAVADGLRAFKDVLNAQVVNGTLHPLIDAQGDADLENAAELMQQLAGSMTTVEAFTTAMSATYPMSTPEEQALLESEARKVAT